MNRYFVRIKTENGNEIHAKVTAETQEEALKKLLREEKTTEIINGEKFVVTDIIKIEAETPPSKRYVLQPSEKKGYWTCTDKERLIVCTFQHGHFDTTQKLTQLNDTNENPVELATAMREMTDWLIFNHNNKL